MRHLIFIGGFLIFCMKVNAQAQDPSLVLPDSIAKVDPEWVDLDNNGVLDIIMLMKSKKDNSYLAVIRGDTVNTLSKIEKIVSILSYRTYVVTDYDRDNTMDVIVSGEKNGTPETVVYLNKEGFDFEEKSLALPAFTIGRPVDLDDDAVPEMVISGTDANGGFLKIFQQSSETIWKVVSDSVKLNCNSIENLDADGDGDVDLFVSGTLKSGLYFSGFLINKGDFHFKPANSIEMVGNTSKGDLNGDGFFEIILMAVDKNDQWFTKKYRYNAGAYAIENIPTTLKNGKPFIADFNYDGVADVNYHGTNVSGDTVNIIQYSTGETDLLPKSRLTTQRFGDMKHDGNLDLLTVTRHNSFTVTIPNVLREVKNEGPKVPKNAFAIKIFDRVFMYWEKPADDHTTSASLTYDVHLTGEGNYQTGEFDLLNEKRLTVSYGNNGTQNFKLLKNVSVQNLKFSIQAIDNSFHPGRPCFGNGSPGCGTLEVEEISACTKETIELTSPPNALWFSFAKGFLGVGKTYEFSPEETDTLFYVNPSATGCSVLKTWKIKVDDDATKIEKAVLVSCQDADLVLSVEPGWNNITWTSQVKGNLGSTQSIPYTVTTPDSVIATFSNAEGCKIIRKIAIKISKPELKLPADHYKIMKGGEVQLLVEGAARYIWTPATGLNQNNIPNPVASPVSTTQYTVTGYDTINCTSQAVVVVTVENTAFVPNLFSPNSDGQNDQLKIYGLGSAQRFTFSIYDRDGALVYRTSDVSEAVQAGWDGTKNGAEQPPGVYFWKVKGEVASGQLLLNGKDSGSIVLIR